MGHLMNHPIEARLSDIEARLSRLESLMLAYVQWIDEKRRAEKGPSFDWDKLIASSAGVTWFTLWTQLFHEYEELSKTFDGGAA